MSTLVCDRVSKSFQQATKTIVLFNEITIAFERGVSYAITGVSGSGKSTLLSMLAGLEEPTHGDIRYDGRSLARLSPQQKEQYRLYRIGLIFQQAYLIDELTVLENILLKAIIIADKDRYYERALELLAYTGLLDKKDSYPHELSGGEQQRVAIARALLLQPSFVLADEATAHLDDAAKKKVIALLATCSADFGVGVLVTTHDHFVAEQMQRQVVLHATYASAGV